MTGDEADIIGRLKRLLPRWFGYRSDPTPVLDSVLGGFASALSHLHALAEFAKKQARIATATGGWLELIAWDFFGNAFRRLQGEDDTSYSRRIRQEVLRPRLTREAYVRAVQDLTGDVPHVWEGHHAPTTGGWGTPALALGAVGRWGSMEAPALVIVTTPRPRNFGIPSRGGWGSGVGGWGAGNFSLAGDSLIQGRGATERDIIEAVDRVRAAGVTALVRFTGNDT